MTLAELKKGETGIVIDIEPGANFKLRLTEMGVTRGVKITMLRTAPFGDPTEFRLLGFNICMRRCDAKKILIQKAADI